MKLLLLGATGRTGKFVLKNTLEKGYQVSCLARKTVRLPKLDRLILYEGDPTIKADLEKAISGCSAVISVLNVSRKSDFPWAPLKTPKKFLSNTMKQLISVMEEHDVKRLVVCSAWGVSETRNDLPSWFRWFIDHSNIGVAYADHERQEKLIEESKLDWTLVRPVGLINANRKQNIRETIDSIPKPSLTISRQTVAYYLVETLKSNRLVGKKVVISKD